MAEKHNFCFKQLQSKCDFDTKEISILGVVVGQEEVQIKNKKFNVVKE